MKINLKQGKYILPIVFIPFICMFFYVYKSHAKRVAVEQPKTEGLQENIADVSGNVKSEDITNKLDAFRNQYKESDGSTPISSIEADQSQLEESAYVSPESDNNELLDTKPIKTQSRYSRNSSPSRKNSSTTKEDQALARALSTLSGSESSANQSSYTPRNRQVRATPNQSTENEPDPMEVFKKQMTYVDSMTKAGDPAYKAEQLKIKAQELAEKQMKSKPKLAVVKVDVTPKVFNTIRIKEKGSFVKAIVDENVEGYAGSRIRLRLLEDITVGGHFVKKGTYIYAQISSFSEQRVGLSIMSIIKENKIFPVQLEVYDLDGMPGLYVPASQFREFSKQFGGNSMQGVNLQSDPQNTNQLVMSAVQKLFTSSSQALANMIRKNKAKLKYNTFIYLIDPQELQTQQSNY